MAVHITRDGNGRMNPSTDDILHNLEELADFAEDLEAGTAEIPLPSGAIALASGKIFVGQVTGLVGQVTMSGDATITAAGVLTVTGATGSFQIGANVLFVKEVNHTVTVGTSTTANTAGGNLTQTAGAGVGTGVGGNHSIVAGAGGVTSAKGGDVLITAGAAGGGTAVGGDVIITPGLGSASRTGGILLRGIIVRKQGTPTAKTISATLTVQEIATGIVTVNQGGAGTSALQLPDGTALDTAFANMTTDDSFDFSVINISTVDAEDASITVNTGVTIVGSADIPAYSAAGSLNSSALFRLRKTGSATWVCYRRS